MRNLIRAVVDQTVAMKISGHRTASTFRRCDITSEDDLRNAVEKLAVVRRQAPDLTQGRGHRREVSGKVRVRCGFPGGTGSPE
jgi:hypothetical protein